MVSLLASQHFFHLLWHIRTYLHWVKSLFLISTSSSAFCTASWLYTLAPSSGITARSSSLLREKSWAPVNTPKHDTVLWEKKHRWLHAATSHLEFTPCSLALINHSHYEWNAVICLDLLMNKLSTLAAFQCLHSMWVIWVCSGRLRSTNGSLKPFPLSHSATSSGGEW